MQPARSSARAWIERLGLKPHPEGGHYRETYRSPEIIPAAALPSRFAGTRAYATAIYFLLEAGEFSAFHRIASDELWHFYAGEGLLIHVIDHAGDLRTFRLGASCVDDTPFQAVVPAGCWFASEPADHAAFALVGCTVAPGFDFADFELADATLADRYPQHAHMIKRLTR